MNSEYSNADIEKITEFWELAADKLIWTKKWSQVVDLSRYPFARWFVDGELNVCYNVLDRQVLEGNGDKVVVIYDSPVTKTIEKLTYNHFLTQVELFSGGLSEKLHVGKGDIVFMYMPNIPESIITILSCARLGAMCTSALGGLSAKALASRIDHVKPKIIITVSASADSKGVHYYKKNVDQALKLCQHQVDQCIVVQRKNFELSELDMDRDVSWKDIINGSSPYKMCNSVKATDPMFMLYTSGTTGEPKGIVFPTGGFLVSLQRYIKSFLFDCDVIYVGSQFGWILSHMMTVYATFLIGKTSILYEGDANTPSFGGIFRVFAEHDVEIALINMSHMREMKVRDPQGICAQRYNFPKLRVILTVGELLEEEAKLWGEKYLGVPVKSFWGQTELGAPVLRHDVIDECIPFTCVGRPADGITFCIVDQDGYELPRGEIGNVMIKYPLSPAALSTVYKNDVKFKSTYFHKPKYYYDTKDSGKIDADGHVHILGRNDSIAIVAGELLPLMVIEEAIRCHPHVAECVIVTTKHYKFGQVPIAFYTLSEEKKTEIDNISNEIYSLVQEKVDEKTCFYASFYVAKLPKSPVGKIARSVLAQFVKDNFPNIANDVANMKEIFDDIIASKYNCYTSSI